jgi:hypothetical protein
MSEMRNDLERQLDRDDADFVRRIEESYRPPELSPSRRVAFREGIDARIQRRPTRGLWTAAVASVAIALTLVVLRATEGPTTTSTALPPPVVATGDSGRASGDDTMLVALAMSGDVDGDDEDDASLPEDYAAIADLFLEGV